MREKLEFGYSANDNTGSYLREGAEFIEDALSELYMFMSGQASSTNLPMALPKVSGGTGASTDLQHQAYINFYASRNAQSVMIKNTPVAVCKVGFGLEPRTVKLTETTGELSFIKLGAGAYKISVFDEIIKVENNYAFVCPDNYGNRAVGADIRYEGLNIFVDTYPIGFDQLTGKFFLDKSSGTVDVPNDTYMTLLLVNTIGNVY